MDHEQARIQLLEGAPPDSDASRLLDDHLAQCAECRAFAAGWAAANRALRGQSVLAPAPGFPQRWLARLELARRRRHRRQMGLALGLSMLGSVSTFVLLAWWVLASPGELMDVILSQLVRLDFQIWFVLDLIRIFVGALPLLASVALAWAGLAIGLGLIMLYTGFSALWTASFYRAVLQTRSKEI
jgi:predicted anti-sigma-YlaC factor YlaD